MGLIYACCCFYSQICSVKRYSFFLDTPVVCGILVPQPEIELTAFAVEVWNLNHWTAREVP